MATESGEAAATESGEAVATESGGAVATESCGAVATESGRAVTTGDETVATAGDETATADVIMFTDEGELKFDEDEISKEIINQLMYFVLCIVCCIVYCLWCITVLCCANNQMQIFSQKLLFFHNNIKFNFLKLLMFFSSDVGFAMSACSVRLM